MKKEFTPYYLSRAILSAAFALLVFGFTWKAILFGLVVFGGFLLYLHSGWFQVDGSRPLTPLRRDERGRQAQRGALIAAVIVGLAVYLLFGPAVGLIEGAAVSGSMALALGILAYFIVQFFLLART